MGQLASEALVERLIDWGVDTVFGLPGDGINGIMEGLRRHKDKLQFVLVHHEEAAAFMATAHAKATGKIGVCLATSGPGGVFLLSPAGVRPTRRRLLAVIDHGCARARIVDNWAPYGVPNCPLWRAPTRPGRRVPTPVAVISGLASAPYS